MAAPADTEEDRDRAPLTFRDLDAIPVRRLKGIGEKAETGLAAMDVHSVLDLLLLYPRRWIDRTREARIADLEEGEEGAVLATVVRTTSRRTRSRRTMVIADVTDGTGRMKLTFFNQPWRERQLGSGLQAVVFGRMELYRGARQMTNPVVDLVGDRTGRIIPIYPQSEKSGLTTWDMGRWIGNAIARCAGRGIADPVPPSVLARYDLIDRSAAMGQIHEPADARERQTARDRLVFDELLRIQVELVRRKVDLEQTSRGIEHRPTGGALVDAFRSSLPFP